MITLENDFFIAMLHPHGAALRDLIFKAVGHSVIVSPEPPAFDEPHNYLGAIVGPVANRIAGAQFELDGEAFKLDQNEGRNTLHGGAQGLSELDWKVAEQSSTMVTFVINLSDLHMGFPGPARFLATYRLVENALEINLSAQSDRPNYFNLAPHIYFNLMGEGDILSHRLQVNAEAYLPTDSEGIPTGDVKDVVGTSMDYNTPRSPNLGDLDHNFCLNTGGGLALNLSAPNGVELTVSTNQPGVQVYNGAHLGSTGWTQQNDQIIPDFAGIAIEPQQWPNALNEPNFAFSNSETVQKSKFTFSKVSLT